MASMNRPVARKVKAATFAALVTAFIVGWVLQAFPSMSGLSEALTSFVGSLVTAGFALAVGWVTKHAPADVDPDA
jgi:hypothetical protein